MKRYLLPLQIACSIGLVMLLSANLFSCSHPAYSHPSEIAERVRGTVERMTQSGVAQILGTLEANLRELDELVEIVRAAEDLGGIADKVIERMERITESYEEVSVKKEEIEEGFRRGLEKLKELVDKSMQEIEKLGRRQQELEEELKKLRYETDQDVRSIRKESLEKQISFVQMRIELWRDFLQRQGEIEKAAMGTRDDISKFLLILEENAQVYREGLAMMKLHQELQEAITILESIGNVEQLSQRIVASWETLFNLVQSLVGSEVRPASSHLRLGSWPEAVDLFNRVKERERDWIEVFQQRSLG